MIKSTIVNAIIGKGFADKLDEPIFEVGGWIYTRRGMVEELGCANFIAAAKLAKVLRRLKINSSLKLYRLDPGSLARTKGIGESCLFVAMCILDYKGFDLEKWWGTDRAKFSAVKHQTLKQARKYKQAV